jgi:DNA-binding transcriptional regulator YdaS (Cro superfamily)
MNLSRYLESMPRGTARAVALAVGVHPVTLSQWANEIKQTPDDRCPALERASGGSITCEEQRPDVHWVRIPDAGWPWHPGGKPLIDVSCKATSIERAAA